MRYDFDLIVIGSDAGGGVGAHHAASLGKKVAVIEAHTIGGECPNFACVPTKALLQAAEVYRTALSADKFGISTGNVHVHYKKVKKWKDLVVSRTGAARGAESFLEDGIQVVRGKAKFVSPHEVKAGGKIYSAAKILIATGSVPFIPPIPGLADAGYITFKEAVEFDHLPKSIFILGGGPIGCEFAQIFSSFGVKVIIADNLPRLLAKDDPEVGELIGALFGNRGTTVLTNTLVEKVSAKNGRKVISYKHAHGSHEITVDEILVATGKKPVLDLDLEKAKVKVDKNIRVNAYLQTSASHIYAAGDIVGPYLFTHTGYYQSYIAVHNAFSYQKIKPDYRVVPRCTFTDPEAASVGMSEEQAKEKGIRIKRGIAPIGIVGRANTSDAMDGFVKVLTDQTGKIIGASIVAPRAGEMIHQLALAMKLNAKASDIASMIHAFPTYSEAIKIACSSVK